MSQIGTVHRISEIIAPLLGFAGSQQFPSRLALALEQVAAYDSLMITRFGHQPAVEHIQYPLKSFTDDSRVYTGAAYLLDPFYRAAVDQRINGFRVLNSLAPEGFRESEYFKRYYGKTGLGDECGYIIPLASDEFLNVSMNRLVRHSPFLDSETALLEAICPLVESLCQHHWSLMEAQGTEGGQLNRQLELALDNFGSSKLTPRECDVVRLLLQGHSTQSMAEKLGISVDTVKIHRRNSYEKLDIGSQSELFHLFITALQSFDVYQGGDPLAGYC